MPRDEDPPSHTVNTGGGAATGNVNARGDFTGRDQIAYHINFFGPIAIKEESARQPWQAFDWSSAEQTYRESLIRQYGTLRVIGATADSPLDNVFTDVFILNQLTAHRRASIEELQKVDPDSFRQSSAKQERVSGLSLIQDGMKGDFPTHFYILGKPGAGKTTFLKYITMQAARHQTIARIPLFVSFHEWTRSQHEDLFTFIVSRFAICHVPDAAPFVKLLLEEGKALLLFDGLDEVRHEGKQRDRLTSQLQDFVQQYDRCQHLITCRIAASEYIFKGFKTVEVADFTPDQIATYAAKWFGEDQATYHFFMQELQKPEQKGVYELCNTPLLLSLICLAFANDRAFPPTHAELYEDALDVLLRRWDNSRQIDRDALYPEEQIYRELSTQRKKELFARIANRTFHKGEYFFRRRDLEGWITEYLATLPNIKAVADIDGQIVLNAIEAQHGVLIERAKDIYAFSHLTFQEYFTAFYLKQNQASGAAERLIEQHLGDRRWSEVFLLTASLLSEESANDFFFAMQERIAQFVAGEPIIVQMLTWADEKTRSANTSTERRSAVRLAYVFFVRTLARARALDLDRDFARARATTPHVGFDYGLFYAWSYAQLFSIEKLDRSDKGWQETMTDYPHLIAGMIELANEAGLASAAYTLVTQPIPPETASPQAWQHYGAALFSILQARDLGREWTFSGEQDARLNIYFAANELLIQCLQVATVSNRQAILNGILEPPPLAAEPKPTGVQEEKNVTKALTKKWWQLW